MEYPLISKELLPPLRLGHGLFNFAVALLFFYSARFGLMIRQARHQGAARPAVAIRRHRKLGPILAVLGALGFGVGLILVLLDTGNILQYPVHLSVGVIIVALLLTTFLVSRKITGTGASPLRRIHFLLGLAILSLYVVQILLGLGVLL
ncbi:MAG: DUF4079 family protein [Desulfurivibrionaceae bacterium]|nr:DUF4079 family protein [Desulfobulbales bacterium]MDT8335190.1 DUF4079 family protein [Desulfurivibrionaceae bacterium]